MSASDDVTTPDAEATALLRRYLETTARDVTEADVLSGCVTYTLDHAFVALEDKVNRAKMDPDEEFSDDAWGYVEEEVVRAQDRRCGTTDDDKEEIDAAVAHMRRMLEEPAAADRPGSNGAEVKARFLNGDLSVSASTPTIDPRCGL